MSMDLTAILERACELAVKNLKENTGHDAILILGMTSFVQTEIVEDHIEDPEFHEYIKQYRDSGYVLIATAEEDEQQYLVVEVWKGGKGLKREIPFQKKEEGIEVGEPKASFKICSAEEALSSI